MARIRTIKPEFPQSESMGNVSRDARLTFIMLWTLADDEGRLRGNSRMLASLLFPYDSDAGKGIDRWMAELESEGCITRYKDNEASYVQIRKWLIHQKIDKPSKSKIPPPIEVSREVANVREYSSEDQGSRIKDQGEDQGRDRDSIIIAERRGASLDLDPIPEIFAYWQKVMDSPRAKLDKKRTERIKAGLRLGYTPRELCEAIKGCSRSPWNMGKNDRNTKYNSLDLILRDADHIDKFMELAGKETVGEETLEQRNARIMAEFLQGPGAGDMNIIDMEDCNNAQ